MCSALIAVKLLCKKPGLKDNNFQALGHKITALGIIAKVGTGTAPDFFLSFSFKSGLSSILKNSLQSSTVLYTLLSPRIPWAESASF